MSGWIVHLPGVRFPIVCDTLTGLIAYAPWDNFHARYAHIMQFVHHYYAIQGRLRHGDSVGEPCKRRPSWPRRHSLVGSRRAGPLSSACAAGSGQTQLHPSNKSPRFGPVKTPETGPAHSFAGTTHHVLFSSNHRRTGSSSHIVTITTKVHGAVIVAADCHQLRLSEPVQGIPKLYGGKVTGLLVRLSGWKYPAIIDTTSGCA